MEVINFRPHDKGALKGFFDLKMEGWGNLIIRGMQLFQKGDRSWVNFPSKEIEKDGEKQWFALLRFEDKEIDKRFNDQATKEALMALKNASAPSNPKENASENMPF